MIIERAMSKSRRIDRLIKDLVFVTSSEVYKYVDDVK